MLKDKKIIFTLSFLALVIIVSVLLIYLSKIFIENNLFNIQDKIYKKYPNLKSDFRKNLFKNESVIENLNNDFWCIMNCLKSYVAFFRKVSFFLKEINQNSLTFEQG